MYMNFSVINIYWCFCFFSILKSFEFVLARFQTWIWETHNRGSSRQVWCTTIDFWYWRIASFKSVGISKDDFFCKIRTTLASGLFSNHPWILLLLCIISWMSKDSKLHSIYFVWWWCFKIPLLALMSQYDLNLVSLMHYITSVCSTMVEQTLTEPALLWANNE